MNFQFYLEKLLGSDIFKEFIKENPQAYMCSGFFTIDKEGKDNQNHIDFYVPDSKEMFSFNLNSDENIKKIKYEIMFEKALGQINQNTDFNFEEIGKIIIDRMNKGEVKNKLQKIIISLQNLDGKTFLVCTVFVSMLGLLKVHIDLKGKNGKPEITLFEKKSFFDILKRVK